MRLDRILFLLPTAWMLGSCVANLSSPGAEDPPIWGRSDCQRGEGNPAVLAEFEAAKARCLSRGESAAAVAGAAGNNACMSEQGYILRTRSEHKAACEVVPAQKEKNIVEKRASKSAAKAAQTFLPIGPEREASSLQDYLSNEGRRSKQSSEIRLAPFANPKVIFAR
jgi:hypothetical protein